MLARNQAGELGLLRFGRAALDTARIEDKMLDVTMRVEKAFGVGVVQTQPFLWSGPAIYGMFLKRQGMRWVVQGRCGVEVGIVLSDGAGAIQEVTLELQMEVEVMPPVHFML